MLVLNSENIVCCDVDDTLVLHNPGSPEKRTYVDIEDPVHKDKKISLAIHQPMVRLLKEELHKGSTVIVWSRGGHQWAENVLKALGIDHDNLLVMSKPMAYFDDKDVETWLRYRVYLDPNSLYKGV